MSSTALLVIEGLWWTPEQNSDNNHRTTENNTGESDNCLPPAMPLGMTLENIIDARSLKALEGALNDRDTQVRETARRAHDRMKRAL